MYLQSNYLTQEGGVGEPLGGGGKGEGGWMNANTKTASTKTSIFKIGLGFFLVDYTYAYSVNALLSAKKSENFPNRACLSIYRRVLRVLRPTPINVLHTYTIKLILCTCRYAPS